MAEYYAVLSRAVASLESNSADARRAVYDKARNALIGQLKAIVPPLPTSEISRQRLELEEAIRRVERESATATGGTVSRNVGRPSPQPPAPPPRAAPPPPPPPPAPVYEEAEEVAGPASPQEVFRRAIRQAETRAAPLPVERAAQARAPEFNSEMDFHVGERARFVPEEDRPAPYVTPGAEYREEQRAAGRGREPRLAPDYNWEPEPQVEPGARMVAEPYADEPERGGRRRGRGDAIDGDFEDVNPRRSRLPTIILLVLIVAMIGGLGALAWSQRGVINDILASLDGTSGGNDAGSTPPPAVAAAPPAAPAPAVEAPGKDDARLLDNGGIPASPGVRVVGDDGGADAAAPMPASTADTGAPAAAGAVGPAGAQKAVLYEEPTDSAKAANGVTQINAGVTWTYAADGPDGPSVIANLDVPERGLRIKLTFRKNTDNTLPASHLIEVVTQAADNFPGQSIDNVPRLVMKPAEDARGQPLIGASAKVANGFFWIALSALDTDIQNNLTLLREREWIDLPLVYASGQRAILTFQKGQVGDRAFEEALAAWTG